MMIRLLFFAAAFAASLQTTKADTVVFKDIAFYVYEHVPANESLELWLSSKQGEPNTFPKVEARAQAQGRKLKFAMNAGIFEHTFRGSGLHISEGKTITKLNLDDYKKTSEGEFTPNFFLKPNGVFFLLPDGTAGVLESGAYAGANLNPRIATQSGPLLVANGKIHPVLGPNSESRRYRNGVGVTKDGRIFFACSVRDREIGESNLYNFAAFFRDKLNCPNALYLDGDISYVYIDGETPPIVETNWFAGIFVVTEPAR